MNPNDLIGIVDLRCKLVEARLTTTAEEHGSMPADSVIASATFYPFRGWLVVDHVSRLTLDFVQGKANAIKQLRALASEQALRQVGAPARKALSPAFVAAKGTADESPSCTCKHILAHHQEGGRCTRGGTIDRCPCQRFEAAS